MKSLRGKCPNARKCGPEKSCVFVTISTESSLIDVWQVPKYTSSVSEIIEKDTRENWSKLLACLNLNMLLPYFLKKYIPENKLLPKSFGY